MASKNIASDIDRRTELPAARETEKHHLTHRQLLDFAREAGRFETMTLVLGYCGLRFGKVAVLRRTCCHATSPWRRAGAWWMSTQT